MHRKVDRISKIAVIGVGGTAEVQYAGGWGHITCWAGEEDSGSRVWAERTGCPKEKISNMDVRKLEQEYNDKSAKSNSS